MVNFQKEKQFHCAKVSYELLDYNTSLTYVFVYFCRICNTVIIYVQNDFSVGSYSIRLSFLMKQIVIAIKKKGKHFDQAGGGGEETRSGTEKRCSHILKSGHPAWWSADNCSIYPTDFLDFLEARIQTAKETR